MKIKVTNKSYDEVMSLAPGKHKRPLKANMFFRTLLKLVSMLDLHKTHFKAEKIGMDKLGKKEPALYLMNHSSFIDLEIVSSLLYPRPFNIVTTSDAFVGKDLLLRLIGCIPTKKFVPHPSLVRDMMYALKKLKSNVVLYPEASYSFDGAATTLPDTLGKLVKLLGVPVIMIRTYGAFARDPLYNNIQVRKVDVSATEEYLLSPEEIENLSEEEINRIILSKFSFDNFRWQNENRIKIDAPTRADYLNRVLYKCPVCKTEGKMLGKGTHLTCKECGKTHILTEYGTLEAADGETAFNYVSDWYRWERECVHEEIVNGTYGFDLPVDILMSIDTKKLYRVGEGKLLHTKDGFRLIGCSGKLEYEHRPLNSYSLYSDFNWYEIGDMICIGGKDALYYCFPKNTGDIVAKARLATEEIYKILLEEKRIITV